jgi:hypothetical protein
MTPGSHNNGRFPDQSPVSVRYPPEGSTQNDALPRDQWPWLHGSIISQCGPDEWQVLVEVRELATRKDGTRPSQGTASRNLYCPICFRDASEIRPRTGERP